MGWLFDTAVQFVAEIFGYQVGRGKPWWVELVASLGCMTALGLLVVALWLIFR